MSCYPIASGPFGMLLPPPRMPHKTLLLLQRELQITFPLLPHTDTSSPGIPLPLVLHSLRWTIIVCLHADLSPNIFFEVGDIPFSPCLVLSVGKQLTNIYRVNKQISH